MKTLEVFLAAWPRKKTVPKNKATQTELHFQHTLNSGCSHIPYVYRFLLVHAQEISSFSMFSMLFLDLKWPKGVSKDDLKEFYEVASSCYTATATRKQQPVVMQIYANHGTIPAEVRPTIPRTILPEAVPSPS